LKEKVGDLHVVQPFPSASNESRRFDASDDGRYFWVYEGDPTWQRIKLGALVVGVIALCMFQLWPPWMKTGVWYLSVTLLLAMAGIGITQLLVFGTCWLAGYDVWILPNLWSDEVPIWEAFSPLVTAKASAPGYALYRGAFFVAVAAGVVYVAQQPPDMDNLVNAQKQFVSDLYSGALLGDGKGGVATTGGPYGGRWGPGSNRYGGRPAHIPDLDELNRMFGGDEEPAKKAEESSEEGSGSTAGSGSSEDASAGSSGSGGSGSGAGRGEAHDPSAPDMDAMVEEDEIEDDAEA
jgi:hypothetical protein